MEELRTPESVDSVIPQQKGTLLVFVNSVCGCAAGSARPGLVQALAHRVVPDRIVTVFAGVDCDATARARGYFTGHPPSSPQIALFRDGSLVELIQRTEIEGRPAQAVAERLTRAFELYCNQL